MRANLLLLASLCLLPVACHSDRGGGGSIADGTARAAGGVDVEPIEFVATFVHQPAQQLLVRCRPFFVDRDVRVEATDRETWLAVGSADDIAFVRMLAVGLDTETLTGEHRARVHDVEHRDARRLAVSARTHPRWQDDWILAANTPERWYAMVPRGEAEAFEAVLDELDRPE